MPLSNLAVRDIETLVHPYTNLATLRESRAAGPRARRRASSSTTPRARPISRAWPGCGARRSATATRSWSRPRRRRCASCRSRICSPARATIRAIELAEKLKEIAPVPISKVFFCNSGSEANDTQVKLVWYMNNALGRPQKKKIISRIKAYHGVTIAAASLTGLPNNHRDFDLPIAGILHTGCPHHYRFAQAGESEEDFATRLAAELEELIVREGPDTVAAFIAEPVMGAGGVIVPPKTYFAKIMAGVPQVRRLHDLPTR